MNQDEAVDLAVILKGLMPRMTDEQASLASREIKPLAYQPVADYIGDFARSHTEFSVSDFVRGLPGRVAGVSAFDRTKERQRAERIEAAAILAEHAAIDARYAEITKNMAPESISALAVEATAHMPASAFKTALLSRRPPSRLLRIEIVRWMGKVEA